ncbi:hypothetical protein [Sphaerisporangium aureirubrum]|uniref:Uncharacterized protein n=1 Tax=Sphaerisporangium aureirubrum TaxID=1544736 RepID=A0ABW1NCM4_9ACTN
MTKPKTLNGHEYAIDIKGGGMSARTEPITDQAAAKALLTDLQHSYPDSVLLHRPDSGVHQSTWTPITDDQLDRIAVQAALTVAAEFSTDLPLVDWDVSSRPYRVGALEASPHGSDEEKRAALDAFAERLGVPVSESVLKHGTRLEVRATYRGVPVEVSAYVDRVEAPEQPQVVPAVAA